MDPTTIFGIVGLLGITIGVLARNNMMQNGLFILGGVFLAVYSIAIENTIFLVLQIVFTIAAIYDLIASRKKASDVTFPQLRK